MGPAGGGSSSIRPSPPPQEDLFSIRRRISAGVSEGNPNGVSATGEQRGGASPNRAGREGDVSGHGGAKPASPGLPKGMTGELMRQVAVLDVTRMSCQQVRSCVRIAETIDRAVEAPIFHLDRHDALFLFVDIGRLVAARGGKLCKPQK